MRPQSILVKCRSASGICNHYAVICQAARAENCLLDSARQRPVKNKLLRQLQFAQHACGGFAGGGAALLHLSEFVPEFRDTLTDAEEKMGATILHKALKAPARLIAQNAGVDGDVVVERLLGKSFATGYNAVSAHIDKSPYRTAAHAQNLLET